MKTSTYKYILFFGLGSAILACSTKKDTIVNRNYHALTTKYNTMYNGNIALDAGITDVAKTYNDNFWEVLPVERMQATKEEMGPTDKQNPNFERAETKATKAIQKHSMYMGGTERNPQMDEAHLLLGQSRYYESRFIPALEAFNYILYKYPDSDRISEAKVWREKTNIRLDNEGVAIKNLKLLLKEKDMDKQVFADANAILAQAYLKTESPDSAIVVLRKAIEFTGNNEEKARYRFITGQLYDKLEMPDSSFAAYQAVIDMNRKSPRRYVIQAHAMQAAQFDYKNGDTLVFMEKYRELLEDRENRPFLDIINHQVALFYDRQDIDSTAVKYYNKSLRAQSQDRYMRASNHRNIAEIYFEEAKYPIAGKYYDSTMVYLEPRSREFKRIKKKRDNLEDVIKYEGIAQVNDSILYVASLSEDGKIAYYDEYIQRLKEQEEKERKRLEEEARRQENIAASVSGAAGNAFNQNDLAPQAVMRRNATSTANAGVRPETINPSAAGSMGGSQGRFPFYTISTVAFNKLEFEKRWGKRPLVDNWRWSAELRNVSTSQNEQSAEGDEIAQTEVDGETGETAPRFTPEFYISQLPTDPMVLDSLSTERNFAYYQLGIIYKEKFKEYERAADKLEKLLVNNPEERLILPSKYNLYKIYQIIDPAKAEVYKQQVLTEFPDSRYAEIIRNPTAEDGNSESPEAVYASLFKRYEEGELRQLLPDVEDRIELYTGDEIVPKFELLKANLKGRLEGLEAYRQALNYTALTYPNSEEGKQAETKLKTEIPALQKLAFGRPAVSWKIVFEFTPDDPRVKPLKEKLLKYIKEGLNNNITISDDVYTQNDNFVVVHGFSSKLAAESAVSVLKEYKDYKIKENPVIISSEDYRVVQIKKNFTEYQALK